MNDEAGPPPLQAVTVRSDRVVTLTTTLRAAASLPEVTMQAERHHKEAWRRLAHQPGIALGAVVDLMALRIMVEALRRIAETEGPPESIADIAREALFQIGDRSIAPLDETDVP